MPEVRVTRHDIDNLVEKLSRLELDLTPPERALLLFMLGVAADSIRHAGPGRHGESLVRRSDGQEAPVVVTMAGDVPSIEDEFANAFVAGPAARVRLLPASVGPAPTAD
jgi:hypothetical protein